MLEMLAILTLGVLGHPINFSGVVEAVPSGDTMIVRTAKNHRAIVRLAWVQDAGGSQALRQIAAKKRVAGRCLSVAPQARMRMPDYVCELRVASMREDLSTYLVQSGNAYVVTSAQPYNPHGELVKINNPLMAAAEQARAQRLGVWANGRPIPTVQQNIDPNYGIISTTIYIPPMPTDERPTFNLGAEQQSESRTF